MRKLVTRVALAATLVFGLVGANVLAAPNDNFCHANHAAGPHSVPPGLSGRISGHCQV
jgi:hypothetical protein